MLSWSLKLSRKDRVLLGSEFIGDEDVCTEGFAAIDDALPMPALVKA